jgi:hypothetical protein
MLRTDRNWRVPFLAQTAICIAMLVLVSIPLSFGGEFIDDFEDGDAVGWERSPQNPESKVFWGVKDGEVIFDPEGIAWQQSISQFNFTGKGLKGIGSPEEWTDYTVEVDVLHKEVANFPGGVRGRVDLKTGSHYVVWLYPGSSKMNLFSNPGWDINTGLQNHGEAPYKPEANKFHSVGLSFEGSVIKVLYDGKVLIEAKDNQYKKGTIALGNQDKVVHYDNVRVSGDGIPSLNASPVKPQDKLTTTWGKLKSSL